MRPRGVRCLYVTKLMIIVGSVRPGRVGLPIAQWVRQQAEATGRFDIDFVDLAELGLPFMNEPKHPRLRQYTQPHTFAWSARVDAATLSSSSPPSTTTATHRP